MVLKRKYLFFKKNFIRSNVRKLKSLINLYEDYIEYVDKDMDEKLDKLVLKYKQKAYQKFQSSYYDYGNEKEIFDVVYAKRITELRNDYRMKYRAYREATRRKIARLEKKGESSEVIEELRKSIPLKEEELNRQVEEISLTWTSEFEKESKRRLSLNKGVDLDVLKEEVNKSIEAFRNEKKVVFDEKKAAKIASFERKIQKYKQSLAKLTISLDKASNDYVAYVTEENELIKNKELNKANKELSKYQDLLNSATTEEDKSKYEKILVTVNERIDALNAKAPRMQDLIKDDEVIAINELCMFFGGIKAVNKLSFSVKKNEIFGLIGPNGAGKTTVFNCITQFYKPTSGQLAFRNKEGEIVDLTKEVVHNVILQGIVRTFQNLEVIKEVTVLDNLLIAAHRFYTSNLFHHMVHSRILKVEEDVNRARAIKVLDFMGLLKYKDYLAWGLPYGILKKIEIARTLMCNPQLIILDEPAAGLNDSETVELAELIRKIRDEYNSTILLVEHDMGLVMDVCDRICAISFGNLLALGTPKEIQSNKAVQEAYLGVSED